MSKELDPNLARFSEPDPELEFTVINELDLKQISWFQFSVWKWNQNLNQDKNQCWVGLSYF
jgi:hypothetical protein